MSAEPPPPSRIENLRTLKYANLDSGFATVFGTLVGGTFLVGLIRAFEGSDRWIGLLTAIPSLLGLLQIPGAIWGRSRSGFKAFVLPGGLTWRLLYIPMIPLPFLPISGEAKLLVLVVCVALASAAVQLVTPIYSDWLAEMVPENSRGWFFSRRNAILTVFGAVGGLGGAVVLDAFRSRSMEATGFSIIFGFGILCAAISMVFYLKMTDLPRTHPIKVSLRSGIAALRAPWAEPNFRRVLVFFVATVAAQAFAGNLFGAFALESLKMPFTVLQFCAISHAVATVASAPLWGYLADKYGNKPVLVILGFGVTLTPAMWLFTHPGQPVANAVILITGHLYNGFVWGGVATCQFNLLLATADPKDRANYIGLGLAVQAVLGAIAPLLGAELMHHLRGLMDPVLAYKWLFITTMGLRLVAVFFLAPIREPGAISVRSTLRDLSGVTPRGYFALRDLNMSADISRRESAIAAAATQNLSLATDEIVKALHDPSPRLRRQAAAALAKMGDRRAVEGLAHMLDDHPDLVDEEVLEALGDLGDPRAVSSLIPYLQSPRSMIRRAAARALGKIGDESAKAPLAQAADQVEDPDLRRASLQALRLLGARDCAAIFARAALDDHASVRIAASEAIAELGLREAAPALRQALDRFEGEASSETAYALGAVGDDSDVPALVALACTCQSIITRRRCLLGVARQLGVETEAYKLFLQEGMGRDRALLEAVRSSGVDEPLIRSALDTYSSGDEPGALDRLRTMVPGLEPLASCPVPEAFLVALPAALAAYWPKG